MLFGRSQWPRGLRHRPAAARLLRMWVRIPPGVWMFVCCECSVLSVRGLCDELITRPEESYRVWCVVVCDLETSWKWKPWPTGGVAPKTKQKKLLFKEFTYPLRRNQASLLTRIRMLSISFVWINNIYFSVVRQTPMLQCSCHWGWRQTSRLQAYNNLRKIWCRRVAGHFSCDNIGECDRKWPTIWAR